ncbi:extracellular solute-binding protein [Seminavis robusta]|uniref:Extracellular solute-binding protein n=1 Tax=Seminavis robusta TaxID=568900 RepID=A0A9N8DRP5_9STRA|nr:extracellular solute-binding protein [Seminavis robusta]|eukprot:Sro322_g116960.1 extracellular solute-binding protein (894) ;mRNA; r:18242-20991
MNDNGADVGDGPKGDEAFLKSGEKQPEVLLKATTERQRHGDRDRTLKAREKAFEDKVETAAKDNTKTWSSPVTEPLDLTDVAISVGQHEQDDKQDGQVGIARTKFREQSNGMPAISENGANNGMFGLTQIVDDLRQQYLGDLESIPNNGQHQASLASSPGAFHVGSPFAITGNDDDGTVVYTTPGSQEDSMPRHTTLEAVNSNAPLTATIYDGGQNGHHHCRDSHVRLSEQSTDLEQPVVHDEHQLVDAEPVKEDKERPGFITFCGWTGTTAQATGGLFVLLLVAVLMALGLGGVFSSGGAVEESGLHYTTTNENNLDDGLVNNSSLSAQPTSLPESQEAFPSLLEEVYERGYLKCFYIPLPPFLYRDNHTGEVLGFNSAWCKAIAAAIFGDANSTTVQYVPFVPYVTNVNIQNNTADVNTWGMPPFMNRHVFGPVDLAGRFFSTPFYYQSVLVGGDPFHVQHCVQDNNFKHIDECSELRACFSGGLQQERFAKSVLAERRLVRSNSFDSTVQLFANGTCNVHIILALKNALPLKLLRDNGYQGEYIVGDKIHGQNSMSIVTRHGDARWADFCNAVFHSLLTAVQHGIDQMNAYEMPQTYVFGENYKNMFKNAVKAVGNYGTIYEQYFSPNWEKTGGLNRVHNGRSHDGDNDTTGLLISLPLGELPNSPIDRPLGPILEGILTRGYLQCGVQLDRPGFAVTNDSVAGGASGMDVDFCQALAASLFQGDATALELVSVHSQRDGFHKLATSHEIDILAGATWNLTNEVREPATGVGFAFSQPYFYGFSKDEDNFCLATLEDDHDWYTFVFWTVAATIFAEERGINQMQHYDMPLIYTYNGHLGRMFRDAILAVGNYGEIYGRNLQSLIPRSGRNRLNQYPHQGPRHYPMPGIMD